MHFANTKRGYGLEEVQEACKPLADSGFIEIKNEIFAHPTDLGEQSLIAAVTDKTTGIEIKLCSRLPARCNSW